MRKCGRYSTVTHPFRHYIKCVPPYSEEFDRSNCIHTHGREVQGYMRVHSTAMRHGLLISFGKAGWLLSSYIETCGGDRNAAGPHMVVRKKAGPETVVSRV